MSVPQIADREEMAKQEVTVELTGQEALILFNGLVAFRELEPVGQCQDCNKVHNDLLWKFDAIINHLKGHTEEASDAKSS